MCDMVTVGLTESEKSLVYEILHFWYFLYLVTPDDLEQSQVTFDMNP